MLLWKVRTCFDLGAVPMSMFRHNVAVEPVRGHFDTCTTRYGLALNFQRLVIAAGVLRAC